MSQLCISQDSDEMQSYIRSNHFPVIRSIFHRKLSYNIEKSIRKKKQKIEKIDINYSKIKLHQIESKKKKNNMNLVSRWLRTQLK